jgi:hypothetical protein
MAYKIKHLLKIEGKEERYKEFLKDLKCFTNFYFRCLTDKAKKDEMEKVYDRLGNKKYAKLIKKACKVEDENPFPDGYTYILSDFINRKKGEANANSELSDILDIYSDTIDQIVKSKAKEIAKKFDIPKSVAIELQTLYPGNILNKYNVSVFVKEFILRMFQLQKLCNDPTDTRFDKCNLADRKFIKKIFKLYFDCEGEVMIRMLQSIMLEKKSIYKYITEEQSLLNKEITLWLFDRLEKLPIKQLEKVVSFYRQRCKIEQNDDHRISEADVKFEEHPRLASVMFPEKYSDERKKFIKKDKKNKEKDDDKKKDKNKKGKQKK